LHIHMFLLPRVFYEQNAMAKYNTLFITRFIKK